jgi:hypothetical protein
VLEEYAETEFVGIGASGARSLEIDDGTAVRRPVRVGRNLTGNQDRRRRSVARCQEEPYLL